MRWRYRRFAGWVLVLIMVFLPLGSLASGAAGQVPQMRGGSAEQSSSEATGEIVDSEQIQAYMATLSDEQVRRLLIEELKKSAAQSQPGGKPDGAAGRLKSFIHDLRDSIGQFKSRLAALRLGHRLKWEEEPNLFNYLGQDAPEGSAVPAMTHVGVLLLVGFGVQWAYRRYTARARKRIASMEPVKWWSKLGGLAARFGLDAGGTVVFAMVVMAAYSLFLHRTSAQTVLLATYLSAIVIVQLVFALLHFMLAPEQASLRIFPLDNQLARYLHRWIGAIVVVSSFGMLTCGLFHVAGTSEGAHLTMVFAVGLIVALMVVTMILHQRRPVAAALGAGLAPEGMMGRIVANWHHFAIFIVVLMFCSALIMGIMGSPLKNPGLKTLAAIALYFPVDWIIRRMLGALIHMVGPDGHAEDEEHAHEHPAPEESETPDAVNDAAPQTFMDAVKVHRIQHVMLSGLRVALGAIFLVWIFGFWGIELPYARLAAKGIFNILIVVCLCYVAWELLSAAIQKRLQAEMPDTDEDMEEGGSGGSRLGTLLLLLRKFVFSIIIIMASLIILSTIGVNIGPLIAGAGVIGLAIGFGAQTLVKDIISGLFFLVDDAFRVGDYIEVGGTRGTVERISIRSMSLRHPRGMVHTIPFGDISNVTNFSRDYIITKLDFRVRYDTDVEKVRKVIKKRVYKPILKNEELAPKLLGKIKSQGVRQLEDSAMIMRVKFKTIPGEQFVIRKEVYRLMKEAFHEEGIAFAHRNVTVYMPSEEERAESGKANAQAMAKAAAAAAASAEEAQTKEAPVK